MPHLRAFRAVRYDPQVVPDLGAVVCPPYDVIGPAERQELAARHPRNAIRLELPVAAEAATFDGFRAGGAAYTAAAQLFEAWQADGTLRRDPRPQVYVYEQQYVPAGGRARTARGFFCVLRIEEYGDSVRRHERTHSAPKEDRYQLLRAVRANLSPVLMLYDDGAGGVSASRLLDELTAGPAAARGTDRRGSGHAVWLFDPDRSDAARELLQLAAAGPLTIADGHHRYETALRYRNDSRAETADPGAEFVLVLLYESSSGGLSVLPTHRLLSGGESGGLDVLAAAAADGFEVRAIDVTELLRRADEPAWASDAAFGVVTRDLAAVLSLPDGGPETARLEAVPQALRGLPVAALDGALERWTGSSISDLVARGRIIYSKDARSAVADVAAGSAEAAFLLPPTPIAAVLEVAAEGGVMPQKSTYFEPKAATGLVFNVLAE